MQTPRRIRRFELNGGIGGLRRCVIRVGCLPHQSGRVISHIHVGVDTRHGTESIHRHRKTDQIFCLQMREAVFRVGMAMLLLLLLLMMMIVNVAGR